MFSMWQKGTLQMGFSQGPCDGEIILDYLGGYNVITRILIREPRKCQRRYVRRKAEVRVMHSEAGGRGHHVVPGHRKTKEMAFPLRPPEETIPTNTLTLAHENDPLPLEL